MGLYKWKRLPMGLASRKRLSQNKMESVLSGSFYEVASVYLNNVSVFDKSFVEHLQRLEQVFAWLPKNALKNNGSKCKIRWNSPFLSNVFSDQGVEVGHKKVTAVTIKLPTKLKEMWVVLVPVGFYRKLIPGLGTPRKIMIYRRNFFGLNNAKTHCSNWMRKCHHAILRYTNNRDENNLTTDASLTAIGAISTQNEENADRGTVFASKMLIKSRRNHSATKRKLFAVLHFMKHFKTFLQRRKFVIVTAHWALVWLYRFEDPEGKIAS